MGLSDRCTGAIPRIDTLCRTIVAECVKRGFQGVLADFETNPYSDRLSFLSRLSARLSARGMALYCPLSLPAEGAALLVGTGLSGGSLRALLDNGYQVVGVFCQPDRPKGRGHKLAACPVKETAVAAGIPVFQPERIKRAEGVEALKSLAPDLCVTAAFGQLLSQEILDVPKLGTINVHASLLPRHRGSAPINWCVMMGEAVTGITTMYLSLIHI